MIVVWPGRVAAGTSTNQPVVNIDFFPTFLDVAGIAKPRHKILDGRSILPVLKGKTLPRVPLFWDFPIYLQALKKYAPNRQSGDICFRTRPGSSVRSGSWVLQQYYENDHLELYNLDIDPGERKNLVTIYPEKSRELYQLLVRWRKKLDAPVPVKLNPDYKPGGCPVNTILGW